MASHTLSIFAFALGLSTLVLGQTFTECDPLNSTCPGDPALGKTVFVDFTKGKHDEFTLEAGTSLKYGSNGAEFTIDTSGAARTIINNHYIFFGKVEAWIRSAPGQGIISSFVLESDVLDEIDWEWLGGKNDEVETNYFGKHNLTDYNRATYPPVTDPENTFHNYTLDWTPAYVKWIVDGNVLRTLSYGDAVAGYNFPQTPMRVMLGNWAAGAPGQPQGTVDWAGGPTELSKAPFTMYVANITIQDYTTSGTTYTYGDKSGSYESILIQDASGKSTSYTSGSSIGGGGGTQDSLASDSSSSSSSASKTSTSTGSSSASKSTGSTQSSSSMSSVSSSSASKTSSSSTKASGIVSSTPSPTQTKTGGAGKTTASIMLLLGVAAACLFV